MRTYFPPRDGLSISRAGRARSGVARPRGLTWWELTSRAVAIGQARDLAQRAGVSDRCRFDVFDLDDGLPAGPPVDVVLCHRFRDRRLDHAIIERLAPGGLLAIAALSEVGAAPGPFRAVAGELPAAFADLDVVAVGEAEVYAWLLARAPDGQDSSLARTAASRSSSSASSMTPRTTSECASATSRFSG